MSKSKKAVATLLKTAREHAGLSQREVADKLGYSTPQFVSNWERSVSYPPMEALVKLESMYNKEGIFDTLLTEQVADFTQQLKQEYKKLKK